MDRIELTGIRVWAFHGVLPHEAELGQEYLVDVTIHLDLSRAGLDDDLGATVDYGALAELVTEVASEPRASLIEAVAERVAAAVLSHDESIDTVDVRVAKPSAPMTVPVEQVAVHVSRSRRSGE